MNVEILEFAELSDLGKKRKNNEDACLCLPSKGVFCVADGMGGTMGGDLASEAITTHLQQSFAKAGQDKETRLSVSVPLLVKAINLASKWIKNYSDEKNIGQMGSTVVALVFDPSFPSRAVGLHAGDSRLYRFRHGKLQLLTADHTAVAELAKKLGRDPESLPARFQNELVRAVGLKESVELDRTSIEVLSNDVFLLCSDGLSRMVPESVIGKVLKTGEGGPLGAVAQSLIDAANERGGKDNVTVVLVRIRDISGLPPAPDVAEDDKVATTAAPEISKEPEAVFAATPALADRARHDDVETIRGETPETDRNLPPDAPQAPEAAPIPPTPPHPPSPPYRPTSATTATIKGKSQPSRNGSGKLMWAALIAAILVVGGILLFHGGGSKTTNQPAQTTQSPLKPVSRVSEPPVAEKQIVQQAIPPPTTGGLVIQSDPTGADVFLGGQSIGKTPFQSNDLPIGVMNIALGTPTHTGMVVALIEAGKTNTTNVMLAARTGRALIASDPPGATVWVDEQEHGFTTPTNLSLSAGRHKVVLKYPDLEELDSTLTVVADETTPTHLPFYYGGLAVLSDPSGAIVLLDGKPPASTPYTNLIVTPGTLRFRVKLQDYVETNLTVDITSRSNSSVLVALRHPFVKLLLKSNLPGAKAWLDNQPFPVLPTNVTVEAFAQHVAVAEFKDQWRTNLVKPTGDLAIPFNFVEAPPAEAPRPPPVAGPLRWTNDLGMVFVKLTQADCWVAAARVTPEQFETPMGRQLGVGFRGEADGPKCVVGLTFEDAKGYAARLTERATPSVDFPPGVNKGHFALPTTNQWAMMVENSGPLGLGCEKLVHYAEWCRGESPAGIRPYAALFVEGSKPSIQRHSDPTGMSIRLVIDQ